MSSIGEEFPREQERVRELLKIYEGIPAGRFAAMMMTNSLKKADEAAISGDPIAILMAYDDLRSYQD